MTRRPEHPAAGRHCSEETKMKNFSSLQITSGTNSPITRCLYLIIAGGTLVFLLALSMVMSSSTGPQEVNHLFGKR